MSSHDTYYRVKALIEQDQTDWIGDGVLCQLVTVMMSDDMCRLEPALCALTAWFVVGSARGAWAARHVLARLAWFPPAATSIRACGSPAHGSPTFFTAGIQLPRRRDRWGRGAMTIPLRLISPIWSGW